MNDPIVAALIQAVKDERVAELEHGLPDVQQLLHAALDKD